MKHYKWGEDPDFIGPQLTYRFSRILKIVHSYMSYGRVLDAGCGDGFLTRLLARSGYMVQAIDASTLCVNNTRQKLGVETGTKKSDVRVGSLTNLPYKNKWFDAIICSDVLEHIKNDSAVVHEFYRVLKSKGLCIITVPGKPELWHEIDEVSGHFRRYTVSGLRSKFESEGFIVHECLYWGFPLNMIWHRFIFKPILLLKMQKKHNISASHSKYALAIKSSVLQRFMSNIFSLDKLFDWTGLGEFVLLVAVK